MLENRRNLYIFHLVFLFMEGKSIQNDIWICAGCGKLPKISEHNPEGIFSCSRCGRLEKVYVSSSDYAQTSANLESSFFKTILEKRLSGVERVILSAQIDELPKTKLNSSSKTKKKSAKKSVSKKPIKRTVSKKSKKSSKSKSKKR